MNLHTNSRRSSWKNPQFNFFKNCRIFFLKITPVVNFGRSSIVTTEVKIVKKSVLMDFFLGKLRQISSNHPFKQHRGIFWENGWENSLSFSCEPMKKSRCSLQRRHLQPLEIRFTANVIKKKSDLKDNFAENRLSRSTSKKETYINLERNL